MKLNERTQSKLCIFSTKVVPILMALLFLLNAILNYFEIYSAILKYIGGASLLTILYLYQWSYRLRFCWHQRMFLHYIVVSNMLALIDVYIGIPLNDFNFLMLFVILFGVACFVHLYFFLKKRYSE